MGENGVFVFPDAATGRAASSIDPNLLLALQNNGGFGGNGNWLWILFLWLIWGANGNGFGNGFGGNGAAGFLSNQMNNDTGRELLMNAIQGNREAINQLATMLNTEFQTIQNGIFSISSAVQSVGAQVGMSGLQVTNAIQSGDAALSRQICECCCENRLAIANQTNAIQTQAASNFAATQLQMSQNHADDRLDICQQTNQLGSQADRNTRSITDAIANQSIMINEKFCDLEKRELQDKITSLTAQNATLRGQIDNAAQTGAITSYINGLITPLQAQVNTIAAKQPNTVAVEYPNLTAVNNTPYAGGYGFGFGGFGNGFWGNGWNGSFWG